MSNHTNRILSHKANSDLTFTYLESLSESSWMAELITTWLIGRNSRFVSLSPRALDRWAIPFSFCVSFVPCQTWRTGKGKRVFCISLLSPSIPILLSPAAHFALWQLLLVPCPISVNLSQHFQRKCCLITSKSYCFFVCAWYSRGKNKELTWSDLTPIFVLKAIKRCLSKKMQFIWQACCCKEYMWILKSPERKGTF